MTKNDGLLSFYKSLSEERLQEEIDAVFDIIWAILEATESDSIEQYPNTNIRIKFSCEVIQSDKGLH